jgi:hypothetical protein
MRAALPKFGNDGGTVTLEEGAFIRGRIGQFLPIKSQPGVLKE